MARGVYFAVAGVCYLIFFATFLYLIGFVGNLVVPLTVDRGPAVAPATAIVVDVLLIALFAVQHSVMARPGFKRGWTRIVPAPIERSIYVLAASIALIVLMALWRPIAGTIWTVNEPVGAAILWVLFALGWGIVLASTFLINHFELFGLQQVWLAASGRPAATPAFRTPLFYRAVRHPLYAGFFLAFWATPRMSVGHLLLAGGMSLYMLIAIRYEERDLVAAFGDDYRAYRARVGMLVPGLGRRA
ncbi:MAG TPA: isoprenylcysteine carboxylmethyltransferase family protein [Sphingomonas sp.]|nr:isoprenylcysteine carboxylmethyltransferase family protein [Sphingomonas sp.]